MQIRYYMLLFFLIMPFNCLAVTDVISQVAKKMDVHPFLLYAIADLESNFNPYALNINRESANCKSKSEALQGLRHVIYHPWLVKFKKSEIRTTDSVQMVFNCVTDADKYWRLWFATKKEALGFVRQYGIKAKIRKVNVMSTDIGIFQINWRSHKKRLADAKYLFDPIYNTTYAAHYLKELIEKHGLYQAIGFYHNQNDAQRQERYRDKVINRIKKLQ